MRLTKAGIVNEWPEPGSDDPMLSRPESAARLLQFWHDRLTGIDDDYTFGDLITLLRDVEDTERLSPLLACDVSAFLAEADQPYTSGRDEFPMQFVQVSNVADLHRYEPDPTQPDEPLAWLDDDEAAEQGRVEAGVASLTGERQPFRVVDATGDDLITGEPVQRRMRVPVMHGSWKPPYQLRREFGGWGCWNEPHEGYFAAHPAIVPERYEGASALDFTPVSALLHLPLRYNADIRLRSRGPGSAEDLRFETQIGITFGEFLHAIFGEIGFHGSPASRDDTREEVLARGAAIDRIVGDAQG